MKHLCLLAFFLQFVAAFGQMPVVTPIGTGMAHATVGLNSPVSIFNNQAGLTGLTKIAIVAAAERRFMVSELQSVAVGAAFPTRSGTFGMTLQSFGFEEFRQQKVGVAYARKLWNSLSVGAQFDYFQTRIPEYGSQSTITFEAGVQASVSKTVVVGAHVFSPAQVEVVPGEDLPTIFRLGVAWKVSEKLSVCSEIEKHIDHTPRWKNGLSYQPIEQLFLRTGFANEPSMLFFGVGFGFGNGLQADMAGSFHQTLGFSPSAGLLWN